VLDLAGEDDRDGSEAAVRVLAHSPGRALVGGKVRGAA
jgi:hypothetical protein